MLRCPNCNVGTRFRKAISWDNTQIPWQCDTYECVACGRSFTQTELMDSFGVQIKTTATGTAADKTSCCKYYTNRKFRICMVFGETVVAKTYKFCPDCGAELQHGKATNPQQGEVSQCPTKTK